MKPFNIFFLILLFSIVGDVKAQEFKTVGFPEMEVLLNKSNDSLYVVNFWATWCKPCVEELPYFQEASLKYAGAKMKMILVSMDFQSQVESKLIPFLIKEKLHPEVWFLNEKKFNTFIPQVEKEWSGALPFTLFFRGSDKYHQWKEGAFEEGELDKQLANILINQQ